MVDMCAAEKWLLTLFMYNWPYKVALRMWDVIIMEGPTAFFGFALSVFELSKSRLLQMDTEQLLLFLTGLLCVCRAFDYTCVPDMPLVSRPVCTCSEHRRWWFCARHHCGWGGSIHGESFEARGPCGGDKNDRGYRLRKVSEGGACCFASSHAPPAAEYRKLWIKHPRCAWQTANAGRCRWRRWGVRCQADP